jgi:hypothetical protein
MDDGVTEAEEMEIACSSFLCPATEGPGFDGRRTGDVRSFRPVFFSPSMTSLNSSSASESTSVFVFTGSPKEKVDVTIELASSSAPPGLESKATSLALCFALPI